MSEEEKEAIDNIKEFIENDEIQSVSIFDLQKVLNYIDKLQKENEELNKLTNNLREENIELIAYKNKLINYIAVRENKTHEDICKEFEIGE